MSPSRIIAVSTLCASMFLGVAHADAPCPYTWNKSLKYGMRGDDVLALQTFLAVPSANGYFGNKTRQAVSDFQKKNGFEVTGGVGPRTRGLLNAQCAAPAQASASQNLKTETATQPALIVSDTGQPTPSIAPHGAGVLFLTFTLESTAQDVRVAEVDIERVGMGNNGAFANFGLYDDEGLQIGSVATLNSLNRVIFRKPFTVKAGEKKTFELYANTNEDLTDYDGQAPAFRLVNITASAPVQGTLPLTGPTHFINNTLTVGGASATLSSTDPSAARTRVIGDTGVTFSGIRIEAHSQEDLTLDAIIWTQNGTASSNDMENVVTLVNGVSYPTRVSPYNEREYVTLFDPGIVIQKGYAVDVSIKGDIKMTAADRTIKFNINDINDEVSLTGKHYGFGVGLSPSGNTATDGESVFLTSDGTTDGDSLNPFFSGSTVSVVNVSINGFSKQ